MRETRIGARLDLAAFLLMLVTAFYLPSILIAVGVIPFELRFHVLVLITLGLAIYARVRKYSLQELGVRLDTLGLSLAMNALLTALLVAVLAFAHARGLIRPPTVPDWPLFFPLYVCLFCPAQEFCCRSVMFAELGRLPFLSSAVQVLISACTYAFFHIVYGDLLILAATLAIGIAWGAIYKSAPNFYGVALSHAVLGVTSILVGLI